MNTQLTQELINNQNISWMDVLCTDKDVKDINIYKSRRITEFIDNVYTTKKLCPNVDLSTLLILLKHRGCVIEFPEYEKMHNKKQNDNVEKLSDKIRGKIISLKSNQYTFNFSVTILSEDCIVHKYNGKDINVAKTYTLTDENGNLSSNWKSFKFDITDEERKYLEKSIDLNTLTPNVFVNSQIAQCMYTDYYYLMKLLICRLVAERKYLNDTKKKYLPLCKFQSLSEFEYDNKEENVLTENKDKYESVKIRAFEVKPSVVPDYNFTYIKLVDRTPEEIVKDCEEKLSGIIDITGEYKFLCRMIECAFVKMNPYKEDMDSSCFQTYNNRYDCKWNEQKVKLPRSRIEWFELMFKQYSLLMRYYDKSIQKRIV